VVVFIIVVPGSGSEFINPDQDPTNLKKVPDLKNNPQHYPGCHKEMSSILADR
jgi:hypothetical protein